MAQYDVRQEIVPVANASTVICNETNNESRRKVLYFRNTSLNADEIITISFGSRNPAVDNVGIVLKQNDQYIETTGDNFEVWQGEITAICAVASPGNLTVLVR